MIGELEFDSSTSMGSLWPMRFGLRMVDMSMVLTRDDGLSLLRTRVMFIFRPGPNATLLRCIRSCW